MKACKGWLAVAGLVLAGAIARGEEPPSLDPFGPARKAVPHDAMPGEVETSDGTITRGLVHLTRDARLKIYDAAAKRQREIPLRAVRQIECTVKREWMERQWRFKGLAGDEKFYTGRTYPAREYLHAITLTDGRTIKGPLAAIVYVEPDDTAAATSGADGPERQTKRFYLHKRDKGEVGTDLKSLVYVKRIRLGEAAEPKK